MIPILTVTSTVMCPHGGVALLTTTNAQALIDGAPALLLTDVHPVVGCSFAPGGIYIPCVLIRWFTAASQTKVQNVPALLQNSLGLCFNAFQIPQGIAMVVQTQQHAHGI
jgi:hypothetical protein